MYFIKKPQIPYISVYFLHRIPVRALIHLHHCSKKLPYFKIAKFWISQLHVLISWTNSDKNKVMKHNCIKRYLHWYRCWWTLARKCFCRLFELGTLGVNFFFLGGLGWYYPPKVITISTSLTDYIALVIQFV